MKSGCELISMYNEVSDLFKTNKFAYEVYLRKETFQGLINMSNIRPAYQTWKNIEHLISLLEIKRQNDFYNDYSNPPESLKRFFKTLK